MAIFNFNEIRNYNTSYKSYDEMIVENQFIDERNIDLGRTKEYDIFLSHSYADREIIPHLKQVLEDMGYKVYVDWIDDKLLSRDSITKETAKILQLRMTQSKSLFYATSDNSKKSKWMPWELGYFDGIKNKRVAILPIKNTNNGFNKDFEGQEYLGLYYYISIDKLSREFQHKAMMMEKNALQELITKFDTIDKLFINENSSKFVVFEEWLDGENPYTLEDEYDKIMKEYNGGNENE